MRRQRRPLGSEKIKAQVVIKLAEEAQIVIKKKKKLNERKSFRSDFENRVLLDRNSV